MSSIKTICFGDLNKGDPNDDDDDDDEEEEEEEEEEKEEEEEEDSRARPIKALETVAGDTSAQPCLTACSKMVATSLASSTVLKSFLVILASEKRVPKLHIASDASDGLIESTSS